MTCGDSKPVDVVIWTHWGGAMREALIDLVERHPDVLAEHGMEIEVASRAIDWEMSRARKLFTLYVADVLAILRRSRGRDVVVVATAGLPAIAVAASWRLLRRRSLLVWLDPLFAASTLFDRLSARALRRIDRTICVRRGDIATLERRYGLPASRSSFIPLPALDQGVAGAEPDAEDPYIYAAGDAFRDWAMFLRAAEEVPCRVVIASSQLHERPAARAQVTIMPAVPIAEGRGLLRGARVVAFPFSDTELASGPSIVVDALIAGKAIVATDTNACRDYVRDGETALVCAPGDATAFAAALTKLVCDERLRARLGAAAREYARSELTPARFVADLLRALSGAPAQQPAP
jgi:glycosyltransferase involved in cell wall biosynthesis